jgi:hypothetical protein
METYRYDLKVESKPITISHSIDPSELSVNQGSTIEPNVPNVQDLFINPDERDLRHYLHAFE